MIIFGAFMIWVSLKAWELACYRYGAFLPTLALIIALFIVNWIAKRSVKNEQ